MPRNKLLLVANWKMNKICAESVEFVSHLIHSYGKQTHVSIAVCPPFTALSALTPLVEEFNIYLGAQNMHHESSGAYTGEISAPMLRELYVHYVILGHSERRQFFSETNLSINLKIQAALNASLKPIVCVGESLLQRQAGEAILVVTQQLDECLKNISSNVISNVIIAYEPIWAIGSGMTASPEDVQAMHSAIRDFLSTIYGNKAPKISILYGGSLKPDNARQLLSLDDVDGGLIGGASLTLKSFQEIISVALDISKVVF